MSLFGKNIRFLRRRASLSQADLAQSFGYKSYTTIQKWEAGQSTPPMVTCLKLADFFLVPLENLLALDLEEQSKEAAVSDRAGAAAEKPNPYQFKTSD